MTPNICTLQGEKLESVPSCVGTAKASRNLHDMADSGLRSHQWRETKDPGKSEESLLLSSGPLPLARLCR